MFCVPRFENGNASRRHYTLPWLNWLTCGDSVGGDGGIQVGGGRNGDSSDDVFNARIPKKRLPGRHASELLVAAPLFVGGGRAIVCMQACRGAFTTGRAQTNLSPTEIQARQIY